MTNCKGLYAGAALAALAIPALLAYRAYRAYRAEVNLFFPERRPVSLRLDAAGLVGAREVTLHAQHETLGAWYLPAKHGAAIVLCHGAGADRAQLLTEAKALAEHGFGLLMFDWTGHGASSGSITWHQTERLSLTAAIDWLAAQPGIDARRLGAVGFSLGGYILAQVAVSDPRIRAMALLGTPANLNDQVRLSHQKLGFIRVPAARLALRRHGIDLNEPQPEQVIQQFAPRALLVVGGTEDVTVPLALTRRLFEAAGQPKQLQIVEGAAHGNYVAVTEQAYLAELVAHFREALAT